MDCDRSNEKLIDMEQALQFLVGRAIVASKTEKIALKDCLNRILANDIHSNINVPDFDNSAMDGYAIALDSKESNALELNFEITDRIAAGSVGNALKPGCCARIFTGAPIPLGADAVVMQEECKLAKDAKSIAIHRAIKKNENIRPKGNDIQKNGVILTAGKQLKPQDIALVASVGVDKLEVFATSTVGVFFTGDELIQPGESLQAGKIFNSNRYSLYTLLSQLGCKVIDLGNIQDDLTSTCDALTELSESCDLIITTGGVSVGEEDHIKPAVESLGSLDLWKIKIKPGKPLAFGNVNTTPLIGLPGNPVSAMVTFLLFARPFIKKMQGCQQYLNTAYKVLADFDWNKSKSRREFVRVRIDKSDIEIKANQYPKQGSDVLSSMVWADGLVEIPEKATFKSGECLNFYPLNEMML